jgi:signal transduction histidine kinase
LFHRVDVLSVKPLALRLSARAGLRLALIQTGVVILAFSLAGYLTQLSLERISQASIRTHVAGEAASLDDEFHQKGSHHLAYTVAKRSRLWRGFEYRLTAANGALLAGRLPAGSRLLGWAEVHDLSGKGARRYLTFTKIMPDGMKLSVGEDTAVEAGEMAAIHQTLLICGALGVIFCVGASLLFARRTWRRIGAVAKTAHAVSAGDLTVRADAYGGAPRDDVDELACAFNGMLDQIGTLVAEVRQVSTDIAHDLRTPLTRFSYKLEQLRAMAEGDEILKQAVAGLETDLGEILRTFDALLQLSEIEGQNRSGPPPIVDLAGVVRKVVEAYRPDIEESGRHLTLREGEVCILGDEDLLAQALANVLENALRHTPKGSLIEVSVINGPDAVKLIVEDNGPGIAIQDRQRALKPFVRLEPSRNAPGSGLGLSIVAAIAARHDAALLLEDANPGLRLVLTFKTDAAAHICFSLVEKHSCFEPRRAMAESAVLRGLSSD